MPRGDVDQYYHADNKRASASGGRKPPTAASPLDPIGAIPSTDAAKFCTFLAKIPGAVPVTNIGMYM